MDLRERLTDPEEALRVALYSLQGRMWTAMPGVIQSFDPVAMTCVVQPAVQQRATQLTADKKRTTTQYRTMAQCLDCPVVFPQGGGCALTFPLQPGDECLLVFASRGIDFWWQQGGVQPPADARMHDLSDGFVIPGPFSQPRKLANVSPTATELRSTDGSMSISLDPAAPGITIQASPDCVVAITPGGVTISGPNGNLLTEGDAGGGIGASGTFATMTGQIVTVTDGLITNLG